MLSLPKKVQQRQDLELHQQYSPVTQQARQYPSQNIHNQNHQERSLTPLMDSIKNHQNLQIPDLLAQPFPLFPFVSSPYSHCHSQPPFPLPYSHCHPPPPSEYHPQPPSEYRSTSF